MHLSCINITHSLFNDLTIKLTDENNVPYAIVALVGENGVGKTTILNELFNYNDSMIINKNNQPKNLKIIYLRQDQKYVEAISENIKLISGENINQPVNSDKYNDLASKEDNHPILLQSSTLNERLNHFLQSDKIDKLVTGSLVLDRIAGSQSYQKENDINQFSSGEQQLLLKLRPILRYLDKDTDLILIDEPETSLHPRWQLKFVDYIEQIMNDTLGASAAKPTIILASHSENILKSLIKRENASIVRIFGDMKSSKVEQISPKSLILPYPTSAELNYLIFKIPSFEYHNALYGLIGQRIGNDKIYSIDKTLKNHALFNHRLEFASSIKIKFDNQSEKLVKYFTLPTYIRNKSNHPEDNEIRISEEDLILSIQFLERVIQENSL